MQFRPFGTNFSSKNIKFPVTDQFNLKHVDCDEVAKIVTSMPANKSPGIDKILVRAIKDSLLATPLVITYLINASFSRGIFPLSWKLDEVSSILKGVRWMTPNFTFPSQPTTGLRLFLI